MNYGNSAFLLRKANERYTFEKSSSRTVGQVATCSRGRRITRNCCDRLGWAVEQFCANTARAYTCLVIVKIMIKKRPRMYDGYCPAQEMPLQRHQSARYFLLPREVGMKRLPQECIRFCSTELPNLHYHLAI